MDDLERAKELTAQLRWHTQEIARISDERDAVLAELVKTMTTREIGTALGVSGVTVVHATNRAKWGRDTGGHR